MQAVIVARLSGADYLLPGYSYFSCPSTLSFRKRRFRCGHDDTGCPEHRRFGSSLSCQAGFVSAFERALERVDRI